MTFLDLFAGVGGFRRGMELAGHKCLGFCEWDKYARMSYISMHCITEEQRQYLATLDLKQRQKEILKDEYLNGEWCSDDIRSVDATNIPKADCWCFGAPCQDFSVAGNRAGLSGDRSSLVREVFRILNDIQEEDRPEWLIYENVRGMLSSNRGFDFLSILLELEMGGYDIEWQLLNSKLHGVPQNRERVYTIGHLRRKGTKKVFPLSATNGKDSLQHEQTREIGKDGEINQIGHLDGRNRDNPSQYRVYGDDGIAPCMNTCGGGGREPHVSVRVDRSSS
jgi:DNA (cytosine-5)-methyltransferase 1